MLPDFPKLKEKLKKKKLINYLKIMESAYLGIISEVRAVPIYEGRGSILKRQDGSVSRLKPKKMSSGYEITLKEIPLMTEKDIYNKLNKSANEMAKQKFELFINEISKSAERVGNVVKLKGRSLTMEDYFELLDKIWLEFDEKEGPVLPTFLVGEKLYNPISEALSKLGTDPKIKRRFEKLIERKRGEWRVRESNRKLVG